MNIREQVWSQTSHLYYPLLVYPAYTIFSLFICLFCLFRDSCCLFIHRLCSFLPPHRCLSELKLQLQCSFEIEDGTPEDQCADPDTPVALVPDQLVAPEDAQEETTPTNEILPTAHPSCPTDPNLNTNCPLSDKLKDLRLETRR